jgi:hypothetical protein
MLSSVTKTEPINIIFKSLEHLNAKSHLSGGFKKGRK